MDIGYLTGNGKRESIFGAAVCAMLQLEKTFPPSITDVFTRINWMPPLLDFMETQRTHGNWEGYVHLRNVVDRLLEFVPNVSV